VTMEKEEVTKIPVTTTSERRYGPFVESAFRAFPNKQLALTPKVGSNLEGYLQRHALLSVRTTTRSALHLYTLRGVSGAIWLQ
jgi:hypothetical protein